MDIVSLAATAAEHGQMGGFAMLALFALGIWNIAIFYSTTKAMRQESDARHTENVRRFEIVEKDIKELLRR